MLQVFIGPNGFGKTTKLIDIKKKLDNEKSNNTIMLSSELIFDDEVKDTVNTSMLMEYIITEILSDDETQKAKIALEKAVDNSIDKNTNVLNEKIEYALGFNNKSQTKDLLELRSDKEYKKLVKINSDDIKKSMGSGQKLLFLLSLIELSKKENILLDEPENHCHPSFLHEVARLINEISKTKNVYLATHSPQLLSLLNIDFNNMFLLNDSNFKKEKTIDFDKAINSLPNKINKDNLNKKSKSYYDNKDSLIKNIKELHYKDFFEALFSKKVYLVEGINDSLFLKKLLIKNNKQYDDYCIFQTYGKPHMFPFASIFTSLDIEVIILFDSDEKPDDNTNKIINDELMTYKYYMFNKTIEEELQYVGSKNSTVEYLEHLDNFNDFDKYKEIIQ